jgi:anti-sigma factor RsiW
MNCRDFNESLYEYLDDALSTEALQAARAHLSACPTCQTTLAREQAVAERLHHSMNAATSGVSLRADVWRVVREASRGDSVHTSPFMALWQWLMSAPNRPVWGCAAFALALVTLVGARAIVRDGAHSAYSGVAAATCVVNVPLPSRHHVFDKQAGTVVDAFVPGAALASGQFSSNSRY